MIKKEKDNILNLVLISFIKTINKSIIEIVLTKFDLSPIKNEIATKKIATIKFRELFL